MGIHGLWEVIQSAGESKSLSKYASAQTHDLRAELGEKRLIRIGVDLSPLMAECVAAASAPSVHGRFTGAEIYILFNKLLAFLHVPAVFIFVVDGDGRPAVKRGTQVIKRSTHWKKRAQKVIEACGYYVHEAPGEAEAELAALNQRGCIHAIISSDSDTLVFGARNVLRSLPKASRTFDDQYILFTAESVQRVGGLTRGGLLLFALLAGGDYSSGLDGFGKATALTLAQAGFGDTLIDAVDSFGIGSEQLSSFLAEWRTTIRTELTKNPSKRFTRRPPAHIALLIDDSFPDLEVVELYQRPLTTPSPPATHRHTWIQQAVNIPAVAQFCAETFDWDTAEAISKKLVPRFWGPVFLQMLYSAYYVYDPKRKVISTPFNSSEIMDFKLVMRKGKNALGAEDEPEGRLQVSTTEFNKFLPATLKAEARDQTSSVVVYAPKLMIPSNLKTIHFVKAKGKKIQAAKKAGTHNHIKRIKPNQKLKAQQPVADASSGHLSPMRNATPGPSNLNQESFLASVLADETLSTMDVYETSDDDEDLFPSIRDLYNMSTHNRAPQREVGHDAIDSGSGNSANQVHHRHLGVLDLTESDGEENGGSEEVSHRFLGFIDLTAESDDGEKVGDRN